MATTQYKSAFLQLVASRLRYSKVKIEGPMKQDPELAGEECVKSITASINSISKLTIEEITALNSMVEESILSSEAQGTIISLADARTTKPDEP